jgi:hypothetical protein
MMRVRQDAGIEAASWGTAYALERPLWSAGACSRCKSGGLPPCSSESYEADLSRFARPFLTSYYQSRSVLANERLGTLPNGMGAAARRLEGTRRRRGVEVGRMTLNGPDPGEGGDVG